MFKKYHVQSQQKLVRAVVIEKNVTKQAIKQNPIQAQKNKPEPLRLIQQKKIKTEKNHICDQCGNGFTRKSDLSVHQNTVHSDKRPYRCAKCNMTFKLKKQVRNHKNEVHSECT